MKIKVMILVCLVLLSTSSFAQNQESKDKVAISETVNLFFKAIGNKDTSLYQSVVLPGGQLWTVRRMQDSLRINTRTFEKDVANLAANKASLDERPYLIEITVHKDIAMAWVPYQFIQDGKISHCGIDVFTLLRTNKSWKIINASYSIEPDGCGELKEKYLH